MSGEGTALQEAIGVIKDLPGSDFADVLKADCFMAYDSKALAGCGVQLPSDCAATSDIASTRAARADE